MLESHVPPFAGKFKCIGCHSESPVETLHKDVNGYARLWISVKNKLHLMQLMDDKHNAKFRCAVKDAGKEFQLKAENEQRDQVRAAKRATRE